MRTCGARSVRLELDPAVRDWEECEDCAWRADAVLPTDPVPIAVHWRPKRAAFDKPDRTVSPRHRGDAFRAGDGAAKHTHSWVVTTQEVHDKQGDVCVALDCGTRSMSAL